MEMLEKTKNNNYYEHRRKAPLLKGWKVPYDGALDPTFAIAYQPKGGAAASQQQWGQQAQQQQQQAWGQQSWGQQAQQQQQPQQQAWGQQAANQQQQLQQQKRLQEKHAILNYSMNYLIH